MLFAGENWIDLPVVSSLGFCGQEDEIFKWVGYKQGSK
jgi:hypothetical protein